MQFWDTVISTMLMGTEKKTVQPGDLPPGLADAYTIIEQNKAIDREEKFLQLASLAFNYRQSGVVPNVYEGGLPEAPEETAPYCSLASLRVLNDILSEDLPSLLVTWLELCRRAQRIVTPELIPLLFKEAVSEKKLQPLVSDVCGKRGEWLGKFNPQWKFSSPGNDEDIWQTGTLEQRKNILLYTRLKDPALALEWLRQTWQLEDANTRAALLEVLEDTADKNDLEFLESLSDDKSKKVKELAKKILKQIPESSTVQLYQHLLAESVRSVKEKALFGMMSKTSLQFELPVTIDEAVFKSGIDKLSPDKKFTDAEYIFYQLIQTVPPSFWETQLQTNPESIIALFQKDTTGQKMIPAIVLAITRFKDKAWAQAFRQYSSLFYLDIIPLLPEADQDTYSEKFFDQHAESVLHYATQRQHEWSQALTLKIFRYTAKYGYQYNKSFYNNHIALIPQAVAGDLDQCAPTEKYLYDHWQNMQAYIRHILLLKNQTLNAFNE